jgi:hypothetical protein
MNRFPLGVHANPVYSNPAPGRPRPVAPSTGEGKGSCMYLGGGFVYGMNNAAGIYESKHAEAG